MRLNITILLLLQAFCFSLQAQTKRALVVAIGQYNPEWSPTSALNDTAILLPTLRKQGFMDIRVLTNTQATKVNILTAIAALKQTSKVGDIVWFHFSGHGQQMTDILMPDENDGLDETLIPYGAPREWKEGIRTDLHLRDEELGEGLSQVAMALGTAGQLLVTLDACHAGSGLRGSDGRLRGDRQVFGPKVRTDTNIQEKAYDLPKLQANTFALFAASPAENNRECRSDEMDYGSLSFALCKALEAASPGETCRDLFDRVCQQMASLVPEQHPEIQGNENLLLFSGKAIASIKYIPIRRVQDAKFVWLEGGDIAGLYAGSVVAFYPIGVTDTIGQTPLSIGTVTVMEPTASLVQLATAVESDTLRHARAYLRYQNFGPLRLRVYCKLPNGPFKTELLEKMKPYPNLLLSKDTFDVEILQKNGHAVLQNAAGYILTDTTNAKTSDFLVEKMIGYMRSLWLRKIDFPDAEFRCEFDLIPLKKGQIRTSGDTISLFSQRDEAGSATIREGDALVVKVRNMGTKRAYFTLLDFQPDGLINMVLQNFEKVRLEPGETWWSDTNGRFKPGPVAPPYGTEMIRLYATEYPVDFQPLINATRSRSYQGPKNALERLFEETRSPNRNPQTDNVETGRVGTFSRVFQIVK